MALHVAGQEYLIRDTLAALESKLDPDQFVRIHRSAIVNLDRVRQPSPSRTAPRSPWTPFRSRLERFVKNALG